MTKCEPRSVSHSKVQVLLNSANGSPTYLV